MCVRGCGPRLQRRLVERERERLRVRVRREERSRVEEEGRDEERGVVGGWLGDSHDSA